MYSQQLLYEAPSLRPLHTEWVNELIQGSTATAPELARLALLAAGPFHVLNTRKFRSNLLEFSQVLHQRHQPGGIVYFARKANKSSCWMQCVVEQGSGVDVASGAELVGALGEGIVPDKLIVTGAEKSTSLLTLALRHAITIVVDSPSELSRIINLAQQQTQCVARVFLRILPEEQANSRFGTSPQSWCTILSNLSDIEKSYLDCGGVAFHLNGYSAKQRSRQAHISLDFIEELRKQGWKADVLDIGGGFSAQYCDSEEWDKFISELSLEQCQSQYFHAGHHPKKFYPYGGQGADGAAMLESILDDINAASTSWYGISLWQRLQRNNVTLALEPGRSLLDGCGMSVFPIQGVKQNDDYAILTVSGLSMSISEQWKDSEFLPDFTIWENPLASKTTPTWAISGVTAACVGGSSCMEYDMLTWRKVPIKRAPRIGDLVIYHNTAGYQMDKNESEFHNIRLPMRFIWEGKGSLPKIDRQMHQELS